MNKGLAGVAKLTFIFIALVTMLFLIYNSVSLASADNATLLTDNANLNINPDCGCLDCSSHLNYTSCLADSSCIWCALCQYSSQVSKVNQWQQAKCVNRGTSCGWQCVLGQCGATCNQNSQCSCPTSGCVGNDWYQYPSHGTCGDCETSCSCKNGTANDQPCYPTVTRNDRRCVECINNDDCNKLDKNYCDGTTIKHDEGKCVSYVCQSITSTVKNCNDGLFCNGQETCQNATCVSGAPIDCSSLNAQCQSGKCDESLDKCVPDYSKFPYSTPCSSNDICKVNHCDGSGSCVLNYNVDCNDNNVCTSDFCDSLTGCSHTPIPNCCKTNADCNDSNACTNDVCSNNQCQHSAVTCNDGVGCTDDSCDPSKGCIYTPNDNNCPSDTTCADYYCDASLGCKAGYAPLSTPCEADNKFCTVDHCNGSGNCVYWKDYNCSSFNISAIATCDNNPDNYHFTWDSRNPFTSACVEDGSNQGHCTTGNDTIGHACSISGCGAECDSTHSCDNKCIGNVRYYSGNCNLASCNCSYTSENCDSQDGCYAYGNGCESRDYSCALGGCNYTFSNRNTDYYDSLVNYCSADTIRTNRTLHDFGCDGTCKDHTSFVNDSLVQDCNLQDGWYNTTNTRWIDIDQCNERQQLQQEYRDYTCSAANCTFNVNNTQWINTSQTRNKPNGTACNDGLFCTVNDVCTSGNCGGSSRDCSSNNLVEISNCDNNPDTNPFTFDYAPGFTSVCNEILDVCTNSTYTYTHTCADANSTDSGPAIPVGNGIRTCTAECDGFGTECQNKCINNVRYFSGACNLTSCGCSYSSTENCTSHNGCYPYNTGCEDRAYGCAPDNCTYTPSNQHNDSYDNFVNYCSADTIRTNRTLHDFGCDGTCKDHASQIDDKLVQDCNLQDGWYNTSTTQWVNDTQCTEKEQIQQEYRNYTCSAAACDYSVTGHQWIDSGKTRNKEDGTTCDDGLYCTNPDTCTAGVCGGPTRDCSAYNLPEIAQCDYSPDSNPFTFDYAPGFTSVCDETIDKCTNSSYSFSHTCADSDSTDSGPVIPLGNGIRTCTAECDGLGTECQNKCIGNVSYFNGNCNAACSCVYSTENCSTHDGCYAYETGCEDRSYYCSPGNCDYTFSNRNTDYNDSFVSYCSEDMIRKHEQSHDFFCDSNCEDHTDWVNDQLVQDCSLQNGWYNTTTTQWVSDTQCTEKEQLQQEYRYYTCSDASCSYNVTENQWIDTGSTRSKENGTSCDDGLYCTVSDVCTAGVCGGSARDCSSLDGQCQKGACNEELDACVPDYSDFPLSTPCQADENKCTLDHCNGSGECVFWKNVSAPNAPNKTIGEPQIKCKEGEWCEYKITTLTPVTLSCGNDTNVSWRYALDGEWKEWHTDESPVTIYFPEESNHTLEAYCTDACGESIHDTEKFKVEGTAFEIPLYKKWNLISVPFVLFNDSPSEVFKNITSDIVSVWTYDNGNWSVWTPGCANPQDCTLTRIKPGWGYWILANNDTDLLIGGELFSPITTPPSKNLQEGWNLVGYYGTEWQTYNISYDNCGYDSYKYGNYVYCSLNSLIDTQQGSPRWSSVWGFDNCGNDTTSWNTLDSCNRMFAGKGYWIEMDVADGYAPASNCIWDKEFKCLVPTI